MRKGGYTLVTLPRTVTPYRDSVDGTRDRVTYQKLVTRKGGYTLVTLPRTVTPYLDSVGGTRDPVTYQKLVTRKGGYTLVTLPRNVTPYRDSVDGTRDRVTYQNLVTRQRYGLLRCAVGIWPSHDTIKAEAGVDVQRDVARPQLLRP